MDSPYMTMPGHGLLPRLYGETERRRVLRRPQARASAHGRWLRREPSRRSTAVELDANIRLPLTSVRPPDVKLAAAARTVMAPRV